MLILVYDTNILNDYPTDLGEDTPVDKGPMDCARTDPTDSLFQLQFSFIPISINMWFNYPVSPENGQEL